MLVNLQLDRRIAHHETVIAEIELGSADVVEGRPFAAAAATERDARILQAMRRREADVAREAADDRLQVVFHDDGLRNFLVVPSRERLLAAQAIRVVGFFGQARAGRDDEVLFGVEHDVIERFDRYAAAGLLSYFDVEQPDGTYGNLILFEMPEVPPAWYEDDAHDRAVRLAPGFYLSVRLHKGRIEGPLAGDAELEIERTRYLEFDGGELVWRAVRSF
jgi:hypothetical protein